MTFTPRTQRPTLISLLGPLIVLVLAFTAIPMELEPPTRERLVGAIRINLNVPDIVANVLGYVPLGIVCANRGWWATIALSGRISLLAETSQLFSKSRAPGLIDIATNALGAVIGMAIASRWRRHWRRTPAVPVGRVTAAIAATLALGYLGFGARMTPLQVEDAVIRVSKTPRLLWQEANPRGSTTPGQLEALWTFEDTLGEDVIDESSHGLNGRLVNAPRLEDGVHGRSLTLNGVNQYVDLGHPTALQLTGSATISAWIKASTFPADDAAVVSDHSGLGYQLDTTVDRGSRTIGFKLANAHGRLMARYGKTPLAPNTWYHIAGVYDAQAHTLNVYLNGRNDNGCLLGTVTNRQRISAMNTYIGRRASNSGFEFAGSIDDVRIYSRALTPSEIEADFKGPAGVRSIPQPTESLNDPADVRCPSQEESADSRSWGLVVTLGLLVGIAIVGLAPTVSRATLCLACLAAGFLLFPTMVPTLPAGYKWLLPVLTLAGGSSIAFSVRPRE